MCVLEKGNFVQILDSDKVGVIVDILLDKKKAIVAFEKFEICIQLKNLKLSTSSDKNQGSKKSKKSIININIDKPQNSLNFQTEIDFHGFTVQEAIEYLDIWIEKALFAGKYSLKIIHGKGSGVLRNAIRLYLKKHKHIKITKAPINSYEDGITYVDLV